MEIPSGDIITKIAQILVALSSLVVSIVALRLSRKVTLKKNLKEKQFELMCQLLESISNEMLLIKYKHKNGEIGTNLIALPNLRLKNFKETHRYLFESKKLVYYSSLTIDFDFLRFKWNTLMPKIIINELKKFNKARSEKISEIDLNNLEEYVLIDFCPTEHENYNFPNGKEFEDFESFHKFINLFFDKIDLWLQSHGAEDLKFSK